MNKHDLKIIAHGFIETFLKAGEESINLFNKGLKIEIKDDNSPVTNGDLSVNKIISEQIASELIEKISGDKINNSSVKAAISEISKKKLNNYL